MRSTFSTILIATIALLAGGCSDSGTEPKQRVPANLTLMDGAGQSGTVGSRLADSLVVQVTDEKGRPVGGIAVAWAATSGGGSLSANTVQTDDDGLAAVAWLLGTSAGANQATATVDALAPVTFTATGLHDRPAVVQLSADSLDFTTIGDTTRLSATIADRYGNAIASTPLQWSSSDTAVARVDGEGLVTSRGEGAATITVLADTARATAVARVNLAIIDPDRLNITAIAPAMLAPGGTATITGIGFSPIASENRVTVQGRQVTVSAATDTQLTITLPPAATFSCQPTQAVAVAVITAGVTATRQHPLVVARQLPELAYGAYLNLVNEADVACNELPNTGGRYLVSIYNTSTAASASSPFRLRGAEGMAAGMTVAASPRAEATRFGDQRQEQERRVATIRPGPLRDPLALMARPTARGGARLSESLVEARDQALAHGAILEKNRELAARLGSPRRLAAAGRASREDLTNTIAAAPQPLTPGAMLSLTIPDIYSDNLCNTSIPVRARVVYAGPKAIVLEDSVAPLAGTMDAKYREMGVEFEQSMLPILEEYFGDPLAFDEVVGGGGRILMLFSPTVNDLGGVAGFVWAGDFFEPSQCAASDEAQIFYAVVPTSSAAGYEGDTVESWYRSMRSTVIHEVKHITSYAERFARNATALEESWLEESTARISEELWARKVFGYAHKGETEYRESIYCEVRPTWPECGGPRPLVMWKHFVALYDYMNSTNTLTPLGRSDESDATFYGSGWLLVRWALDHFAASEPASIRALTQESSLRGVQNLMARTGKSLPELLGPWSLSLFWDWPTAPGLAHPSWDTYDIYAGLNADFPDYFTDPYPLYGWPASFGAFVGDVDELRGGSAALFFIGGTQMGTQLLELQGYGGGARPASLRMAVMRIE